MWKKGHNRCPTRKQIALMKDCGNEDDNINDDNEKEDEEIEYAKGD